MSSHLAISSTCELESDWDDWENITASKYDIKQTLDCVII